MIGRNEMKMKKWKKRPSQRWLGKWRIFAGFCLEIELRKKGSKQFFAGFWLPSVSTVASSVASIDVSCGGLNHSRVLLDVRKEGSKLDLAGYLNFTPRISCLSRDCQLRMRGETFSINLVISCIKYIACIRHLNLITSISWLNNNLICHSNSQMITQSINWIALQSLLEDRYLNLPEEIHRIPAVNSGV